MRIPQPTTTTTYIVLACGAFLVAILNFAITPNPHVVGHRAPSVLNGIGFLILGIVLIFPIIRRKIKK